MAARTTPPERLGSPPLRPALLVASEDDSRAADGASAPLAAAALVRLAADRLRLDDALDRLRLPDPDDDRPLEPDPDDDRPLEPDPDDDRPLEPDPDDDRPLAERVWRVPLAAARVPPLRLEPELRLLPELPELRLLPELPEPLPELPELRPLPEPPELPELRPLPELPELRPLPELPELPELRLLPELPELPELRLLPELRPAPELRLLPPEPEPDERPLPEARDRVLGFSELSDEDALDDRDRLELPRGPVADISTSPVVGCAGSWGRLRRGRH
jgi:hypothetical protein